MKHKVTTVDDMSIDEFNRMIDRQWEAIGHIGQMLASVLETCSDKCDEDGGQRDVKRPAPIFIRTVYGMDLDQRCRILKTLLE